MARLLFSEAQFRDTFQQMKNKAESANRLFHINELLRTSIDLIHKKA